MGIIPPSQKGLKVAKAPFTHIIHSFIFLVIILLLLKRRIAIAMATLLFLLRVVVDGAKGSDRRF